MPPSQRWTEGQEAQLLLGVIKDTIKGIKIPTALWKDLAPKLGKSVSATHFWWMVRRMEKEVVDADAVANATASDSDADESSPESTPAPRTTGKLKPVRKPAAVPRQTVKTETSTESTTQKRQAVADNGLPRDARNQTIASANLKRKHQYGSLNNRSSGTMDDEQVVEVARKRQQIREPITISDSDEEEARDVSKRAKTTDIANITDIANNHTVNDIDPDAVQRASLYKRVDEMLASMKSGNTQISPAVLQRKVKHGFQDHVSNSGDMISEPQRYASPRYDSISLRYVPNSTRYKPTSLRYVPNSSGYKPTSPRYEPTSPSYTPNSAGYKPTSPGCPGIAPNSPGYAPTTSRYVPTSLGHAPISNSSSGERTLEDQSEQDNTYRSDEVNQNVGLYQHDSIDRQDGIYQHDSIDHQDGIYQHDGINQRHRQHNRHFRGATTEVAYVDSAVDYLHDQDRIHNTTELQKRSNLPIFHEGDDDDGSGMYEAEDVV